MSELLEEGPYGLTKIDLYDFDDAMVSPLHARVSLSIYARGARRSYNVVNVFDAASATVADAYIEMSADKEQQAQAAQWLLDLCGSRYGIECTAFTHSTFNIFRN